MLWHLALLAPDPITRDGARDAAERELSRPVYQAAEPSLFDRAVQWLVEQFGKAFARLVTFTPGGVPSLVVVLVLLVLVVVALRLGLGPVRRHDRLVDERRGARAYTPDDYRQEAERYAAAGDHREALRARFRAVIRELERRGVLDPRPGRTAGEIAREAGAAVLAVAAPLGEAAALFDAVWYGERPAGAAEYARMVAVDTTVTSARLAVVAR